MNPLTLVKRIQKINSQEAALGISEGASWHAKYKESAYVFVGGIPFDLTEGDLLAVFAQYGEIVDVNLVRDKGTGKSKGFAFVAYEDQRSTNLAVDNLNGAQILGRIIRVDHVSNYKKKEEEDEETERQKREARGVCRAFQRGECTRGAGCKFSHDEQRVSNTGWGSEDKSSRWGHDKFQGSTTMERRPSSIQSNHVQEPTLEEGHRFGDKDARSSRTKASEGRRENRHRQSELDRRDQDGRGLERPMERKEKESNYKEDRDRRAIERRPQRHEFESNRREDHGRREEDQNRRAQRSGRHESEPNQRDHDRREENQDRRASERRSGRHEFESNPRDDQDRREEKRSRRLESNPREDQDRWEDKRSRRHEPESDLRENPDKRGRDRQSGHDRDTASHRRRER